MTPGAVLDSRFARGAIAVVVLLLVGMMLWPS
jgi:hypothetical protein